MSGWGPVAVAGTVLAVFLLVWAVLGSTVGRTIEQRRLASLKVFTATEPKPADPPFHQFRETLGQAVDEVPALARFAARSEPLLDQLENSARPAEWLALRAAGAVAGAVLLALLLPAWLGLPVGLLIGFNLPTAVLQGRIRRRRQRFADDLPGILHLMLSSLRSGFTLQQSVEAAVRDDTGPVAEELRRALSETRISGEFEDALERVGERVGSTEMVWLVMALRLQKEVGGSLAEVMQTTAETMRERAALRRHVRTLSAEGRISAYVLTALPLVTGSALFVMRPEYVKPLYTELAGIAMSVVAMLLMVVGVLWLRASVRIDV
ncbi:type II secretion system F family protein [Paractinoplanes rishiriensis]|uniref:Type II secretion system protein GspF domain-containing protein n=1 Tax=Paractinoplanes rishiriensis TaxID=1050105 RepID=A0A919K439_9ACTN|nr:type II secretion system F family protein [Actinoplanes rishiriensis]GIE98419.1 hypothetical protein Ari01nite_58840 [Actinoplanes rishiriensis]